MIHIYKDEHDEINIKLIANKFIKVKESRIVTVGLLILRICLLWFIYRYCLTNFFYILPFNTPWNQLENIENKWVNVSMRGLWWSTYTAQFWILDPRSPLPTYMYAFGLQSTHVGTLYIHKASLPTSPPIPLTPSPHIHTQTHMLPSSYLQWF